MKYMKSLCVALSLLAVVSASADSQSSFMIPHKIELLNDTSVTIVIEGKKYRSLEKAIIYPVGKEVSNYPGGMGYVLIQDESGREIGCMEYPVYSTQAEIHYPYYNNFSYVLNKAVCAELYPDMFVISFLDEAWRETPKIYRLFSGDSEKEKAITELKSIIPVLFDSWTIPSQSSKYCQYQKIISDFIYYRNFNQKESELAYAIIMNWSGKGISREALKYRFDSEFLVTFEAELRKLIRIEFNRIQSDHLA